MSDGEWRSGVQYDPRHDESLPFKERVYDYREKSGTNALTTGQEGTASVDQTPGQMRNATVRFYDKTAINESREGVFRQRADRVNFDDIPLELVSIDEYFNKSEGESEDENDAANQGFSINGTGSGTLNPRASISSSASVRPALAPKWKRFPRRGTANRCEFYINGDFDEADLLTRLTAELGAAVSQWPYFVESSETIVLQGQSVQVSAKAETSVTGFVTSPSTEGYAYSRGKGHSTEGSVNNDIYQLPPCIHGAITFSPNTDTADAEAQAIADAIAVTVNSTTLTAVTNDTGLISKTATASILPTSLSATDPASVPTTGLYLYDWRIDDTVGYGDVLVIAWVINAAIFA